jgi:hypothetical protein
MLSSQSTQFRAKACVSVELALSFFTLEACTSFQEDDLFFYEWIKRELKIKDLYMSASTSQRFFLFFKIGAAGPV